MLRSILTSLSFAALTSFPHSVQAQITNPVVGTLGNNPTAAANATTFTTYFINVWRAVISVGGLAVIVYFIWGAIDWITAGGDQGKIQQGRDKITQAVIGMIILAGSFVIIGWVGALFFGGEFDLLELTFPDPT